MELITGMLWPKANTEPSESQIENVLLENLTITAEEAGLEISHAKGVQLKNVKVNAKKGEPVIVKDAEVAGLESAK